MAEQQILAKERPITSCHIAMERAAVLVILLMPSIQVIRVSNCLVSQAESWIAQEAYLKCSARVYTLPQSH